ncbi:nucleoside-diphosphate-sugar epimerase [Candidatus Magnetoovum chiemensis]|nr:nucleoside-diphosphate-sugar epimerase [Candidatus Magnetoovum chiemensis]
MIKPKRINTILVTGANGFIGHRLCDKLSTAGYAVKGLVRRLPQEQEKPISENVELYRVNDIENDTSWAQPLSRIDCIVHLAARVHVMDDKSKYPLIEYRKANLNATNALLDCAARLGVQRFIFISTVKVHGDTTYETPFDEHSKPAPTDPYGISKLEAEESIRARAENIGIEYTIIRAPLVYGPSVRANFLTLLKLIALGLPLPFGAIENLRSFIYLDNIVDALIKSIQHRKAANETFLVSDGEDVSTPTLIKMIANAMGKRKPLLIPVPCFALQIIGSLSGKKEQVNRLINSLQIDSTKIQRLLHWQPPYTMEEAISNTVAWYCNSRHR